MDFEFAEHMRDTKIDVTFGDSWNSHSLKTWLESPRAPFSLYTYAMIAVILEILIALLFPPAAVAMNLNFSTHFRSLVAEQTFVSTLGYLPGHVHAFWIIWRKYDAEERSGYYRGNQGHNYGSLEQQPPPPQQNYQPPQSYQAPPQQAQPGYDSKPPAYQKN
ncbi:hypothetical protein NQZ79_g4941 [Umbelopsis isabellina]|nr:hypothetical protein NQZ79_g4941 [Umbelopsis isabellina]